MSKKPRATGHVLSEQFANADLVDAIFAYIAAEFPDMYRPDLAEAKIAVREEFGQALTWVRGPQQARRQELVRQVLSLFDGRNASEVARRVNISRATVYRIIKQPGVRDEIVSANAVT